MKQYRYYNRDLKDLSSASTGMSISLTQSPRLSVGLAAVVLLVGSIIWFSMRPDTPVDLSSGASTESTDLSPGAHAKPVTDHITEKKILPPPALPQLTETAEPGKRFTSLLASNQQDWNTRKINSGDSLYHIFKKLGANNANATLVAKSKDSKLITNLRPGKMIHVRTDASGDIVEMIYEDTSLSWVHAVRESDKFAITRHYLPTSRRQHKVAQHINSSLYAAAQRAGISDTHIMNLTEIFGWDIDFSLNVQAGDSFKIIYDDVYVDGEKKLSGNILAAEFVNNGKTFRAIAHPDDSGDLKYYAPDGTSMQKTFLRSPVKFSRISSRFTKARFHPVLKKWRAHKGVDYAAGRGTPIRATANGKISHLGRKGGYGKTIIINNGSTYSTLYAHLSSYSRGLKKGSHVKQGQVIGKVGSTGLASGPHLHYEFRINGKHVNPLTFRQPAAEPISNSQRDAFLKTSERMNLELDSIQILQVATESTLDNS